MNNSTTQPEPGHRAVIEAALDDWWTRTDPIAPFHIPAVAVQVEMYLLSSGYTITPDTREHRMPTRRSITSLALIALLCAASATAAALREEWWWAGFGALATAALTRETLRDLTDRRHQRAAR